MNTLATNRTDHRTDRTEQMQIVIVGHVDHGKSTLLGRLYADTGSLAEGKLERVQAICRQQGKEFEYAFLFDAFLEEQEQGVTIDTARTFFGWHGRQYIIIDAPGHKEFLKNMVSGAARAEAALLVIDAVEGVRDQSRRHGLLLSLLGVKQVAVVVNKMDLVGYRQDTFEAVEKEFREYLSSLNVVPERVLPVSAKCGDNIATRSERLSWYSGPTVLETLSLFTKETAKAEQPLRLPVQDVYKFDARRIIVGRVSAGRVRVGDRLIFSPSNKSAHVKSVEAFNVDPPPTEAISGECLGITLDEQIFIERGEVATHEGSLPLVSTSMRTNVFWLGRRPLERDRTYVLRLATRETPCELTAVHRIVSASDLTESAARTVVERNEVAEVTLRTKSPVAFDLYGACETTGRFVLVDGHDIAGGGIVTALVSDEQEPLRTEARARDFAWVKGEVQPEARARRYGHRTAIVLFVGQAFAGKAFLARKLEALLVNEGRHAYLLDEENLKYGLDADLGGSAKSTSAEVVRRYGEVARVLIDAGMIVISTTNAFGGDQEEVARAIRTLVYPTLVLSVHMGKDPGEAPGDADLTFSGPEDFDAAARQLIERLTHVGILAQPIGQAPAIQYTI